MSSSRPPPGDLGSKVSKESKALDGVAIKDLVFRLHAFLDAGFMRESCQIRIS
jgi:hypothetical protein